MRRTLFGSICLFQIVSEGVWGLWGEHKAAGPRGRAELCVLAGAAPVSTGREWGGIRAQGWTWGCVQLEGKSQQEQPGHIHQDQQL